ncbi:hypothetical protein [Paludibacter jiangxiensis]|uniref:Uncharacterized protein n=1 Tax=Paludibacter jiangxiensis TaxID=681398 RepID=A0A161LTM2_9BACT|nr:hypothetical protein [Paludibacter jiangxiensis]GAT64360.1 hypothetical protein PJIAN_4911 [Paludibacter jiangxiensis]
MNTTQQQRMQLGRKISFLKRVIEVCEIADTHMQNGATQRWIYKNVIKKQFNISMTTFSNYLSIPAKKELAEALQSYEGVVVEQNATEEPTPNDDLFD